MIKPKLDIELSNDRPSSLYVYGHEFEAQEFSKLNEYRTLFSKVFHSDISVTIEELEELDFDWDYLEVHNFLNKKPGNDNQVWGEEKLVKAYKCFVWYNEILMCESYASTPHEAFNLCEVNNYLQATEVVKNQLNEIRLGVKDQILLDKIKL